MIDTGVFFGLFDSSDSHHWDSVAVLLGALEGRWGSVFTSNYIVLEATLLIGGRLGGEVARGLPRFIAQSGISEKVVDEVTHAAALELFQEDPAASLTDAATIVLIDSLGIETLLTFDKRSFSKQSGMIKGDGYWETLPEKEKRAANALGAR